MKEGRLGGGGPRPHLLLQARCVRRCCHLVVTLGHCPEPLSQAGGGGVGSANHPPSAEHARPPGAAAQACEWHKGTVAGTGLVLEAASTLESWGPWNDPGARGPVPLAGCREQRLFRKEGVPPWQYVGGTLTGAGLLVVSVNPYHSPPKEQRPQSVLQARQRRHREATNLPKVTELWSGRPGSAVRTVGEAGC